MTEPPDLMEATDGSTALCRLEPKRLRVTYTCEIEMNEMTELMKAAKDSSVMRNKMKESDKLWTDWNKQNLCCEYLDDAVAIFENALSHIFCAVLECDVLVGDGINVAGATYRTCLAMMISAPRKIGFIRKIAYLKHCECFEIDDMMIDYKNTYEQFVNCAKIGTFGHLNGGAEMADPEKTKSAEHETELTNMKEYINYIKDFEGSKVHTLSHAAAFRSDLPGIVTNDKCQETIGLVTDGDKSTAEENCKVSGSAGSFRSFKKRFFKFPLIFPVQKMEWWGDKTLF